ncbi:MAG TPA: EAL domain-containing protein, partial [Candidatus Manganitrophaceae bacterium]|nr:EAL domain-containing protein [Candidatus Manganitrophaceae bacterium]
RLALMGELRHAIDDDQLFPLFQPKINLQTGRAIGVETLIRWRHPNFGVVPPDQFIPLAEQTGLIKPVTSWVLAAALRQCRLWLDAGLEFSVAVNLSVRNLLDPQLPNQIGDLLDRCGVAPHFLVLEITESIIMADPAHAMKILSELRKMGIGLSIDDFGTGYSSLGYLKKLAVDEIKIDKSFVKEMAQNEDDTAIVRSTIDLAHNLGLKVVAEGVENQEIWKRLIALGCDAAQGYYFSRPIAAPELTQWMTESRWGLKRDSSQGGPLS